MIFDNQNNKLLFKSFHKSYWKFYANLIFFGWHSANSVYSHLVRNNENIIIFGHSKYNVYDIKKDKWSSKYHNNNTNLKTETPAPRSLVINDEILIISEGSNIYFYSICNQDILNPRLLAKYKIKTSTKNGYPLCYFKHGMCCTKLDIHHGQIMAQIKHIALKLYYLVERLFGAGIWNHF